MAEQVPTSATRGSRIGNYIVYAALAILAVAVGIYIYWSYQKTDILEVKNSPVPVRTIRDHPAADGVVILKVDFCKKSDITGKLRTSFVSPSREIFLPVAEDKSVARCEVTEIPILIPKELPEGDYKVKFSIEYKINPIKTHTEEFESLSFHVYEQE